MKIEGDNVGKMMTSAGTEGFKRVMEMIKYIIQMKML